MLKHRDVDTPGAAPCQLEALQLDLKGLGEPGTLTLTLTLTLNLTSKAWANRAP